MFQGPARIVFLSFAAMLGACAAPGPEVSPPASQPQAANQPAKEKCVMMTGSRIAQCAPGGGTAGVRTEVPDADAFVSPANIGRKGN